MLRIPAKIKPVPAVRVASGPDFGLGWRLQPGGGARLVALDLALVEEVGRCMGEEGERATTRLAGVKKVSLKGGSWRLRNALAVFREQTKAPRLSETKRG